MDIKQLEKQKVEIERQIEILKNKVETVIIDNYEYETKDHTFNKKLSEIEIPKGWELWTIKDTEMWNDLKLRKKLNLDNCWFFIKQVYNNGYVARFNADSDWADLDCDRGPDCRNVSLGVRFKRKLKRSDNTLWEL